MNKWIDGWKDGEIHEAIFIDVYFSSSLLSKKIASSHGIYFKQSK